MHLTGQIVTYRAAINILCPLWTQLMMILRSISCMPQRKVVDSSNGHQEMMLLFFPLLLSSRCYLQHQFLQFEMTEQEFTSVSRAYALYKTLYFD